VHAARHAKYEDAGKALVISLQLELPFSEWQVEPWAGKSPRTLTRGSRALFLRRKPQKADRFFVDPDQIDMFRRRQKKAPREVPRGAPLLVPLKRGVDGCHR